MPKSYLENFDLIENKVRNLNWPKNPKVIMTSYSHYLDEIFQIYTALKIEKKTKLVILQHGHQGHHQMCGSYFEKKICDNYISWGNKSNEKKNIPLFITTNIGKTIKKKNPIGILLKMTEFQLIPWKTTHAPRDIESVISYKNNIKTFLKNLNKINRKNTTIKSYDFAKLNFITKNIKNDFKDIKINRINKLVGRGYEDAYSKELIIETYNSTGFIELLSMNSPVVLVTSPNLFYVKSEYKKYYDLLIKNQIIFFDAKKAAECINKNLPNIGDWWQNKERQKSIKFFCDNMCKYEKNNIKKLSKVLKKIAN